MVLDQFQFANLMDHFDNSSVEVVLEFQKIRFQK